MPPTLIVSNDVLGIQLHAVHRAHGVYGPGDTIFGRVYRTSPIVSPTAIVKISLHGRTKSKLEVIRGNTTKTYRGRFSLINDARHTQQLYNGPMHIAKPGDAQEWPFALTIPSFVEPGVTICKQDVYLPLDEEIVRTQPLPPSFIASSSNGSAEGFVEYYLEAVLSYHGQKSGSHSSSHPIQLRNYVGGPPIVDWQLRKHLFDRSATSQRLIPGIEYAELSKSQKMKKFFGTPSVPDFRFRLEVDAPTVIQLENQNPVSFRIRAIPLWDKTSEIIRHVPQTIRLRSFVLKIREHVEVAAEGTWKTNKDDFRSTARLSFDSAMNRFKVPLEIPCGHELNTLDLGDTLNVRIGHQGAIGESIAMESGTICPDFTTWNIKCIHTLGWELKFEIAREEIEFKSQVHQPLILLGPSDDLGDAAYTAPP